MKRSLFLKRSERDKIGKKGASFWVIYVLDYLAFPLTWFFAARTTITPNQVTFLSLLLGLFSAFLFYKQSNLSLIWGSLFFQMSFFLDCVDGKLARLTNAESVFGEKLEFVRDKITHIINLAAITFGYFRVTLDRSIFYIALIYFIVLFCYWIIYRSPIFKSREKLTLITSVEVLTVVFVFLPLFNQVKLGLELGIVILVLLIVYGVLDLIFRLSEKD